MEIEISEKVDSEWDKRLLESGKGSYNQTVFFSEIYSEELCQNARWIHITKNGELVGQHLYFSGWPIYWVAALPFGDQLYLYVTEKNNEGYSIRLLILAKNLEIQKELKVLSPIEKEGIFQNHCVFREGDLVRVYFAESPAPLTLKEVFKGKYRMKIKSAVSKDGIFFEREDGARLDTDLGYCTVGCHSPAVFKVGGKYLMAYSGYWGIYLYALFQAVQEFFRRG